MFNQGGLGLIAHAQVTGDPTHTLTLRRAYSAQMTKRFRALKGVIRKSLIDNDAFGLRNRQQNQSRPTTNAPPSGKTAEEIKGKFSPIPPRRFDFRRSSDKIEGFMEWLDQQQRQGILEVTQQQQIGRAMEDHWQNMYVRSAYQKGILRARQEMQNAGYAVPDVDDVDGGINAVFNQPFHADRCFIDSKVPIYTSRGWKAISKIQVGDFVLTHTGKFRKVYNTPRQRKQTPDVAKIVLRGRQKQNLKLTVTFGHPILVNGIWKSAEDVRPGDKISYLASRCEYYEDFVGDEIARIIYNYEDLYEFTELEVEDVRAWALENPTTLYNLSVEEDESYIAKGFVVHNCGAIYTRTFNELKGITDAMDQQISRELAEGLARGDGPEVMARRINDRVDKVGLSRARTLARTETIRAHHSATIQEYRNAGVEGVKIKAEWSTAGDGNVCELCALLEGQEYELDTIEGMIPRHPS